jgi:hypothetical protein
LVRQQLKAFETRVPAPHYDLLKQPPGDPLRSELCCYHKVLYQAHPIPFRGGNKRLYSGHPDDHPALFRDEDARSSRRSGNEDGEAAYLFLNIGREVGFYAEQLRKQARHAGDVTWPGCSDQDFHRYAVTWT